MTDVEPWPSELGIEDHRRPDGTPRVLFKYLPPGRLDVLNDNEIRFTQPLVFNDAFDSRPYFRNLPRESQGPGDVRDVWEEEGQFSFAAYMETCVEANVEMSPKLRGDDLRQFLLSGICSVVGVLSVSETPADPLMWAHYGDAHKGFVVGLDTDVEFFRCYSPRTAPREGGFHPVRYVNERPRRRSYVHVTPTDAFFTKSDRWSYEREWRQYRLIRNADRALGEIGDEIALFRFPREAIRFVIAGMDMETESRETLRRAVVFPSDYREHVRAFTTSMDSRFYRLRFSPMLCR